MTLRRLAGDTLIYGTGYILGKVLNYLLITIYITRKFAGEEEQYGLYTDFYFYVALLLVFLTLRMETTYFRFASDPGAREKAFSQASIILIGISLLWLALVFFGKTQMAEALEYPGFEKHVVTLGLILTLDVMVAVPMAALRFEGKPTRYTLLRLLGPVVNIIAVLFFFEILPPAAQKDVVWAQWYEPDDRLYYLFLSNLIGSLLVFCIFLPGYFRIRWSFDAAMAGKMLRYTLPLVVVGVAGVINQSSYITFQKYLLPNTLTENLAEGGVYAAATRIALLMSLFTIAFNYAAEPFFFQHARGEGTKQIYADVAKAFTITASVLMAALLLSLDIVQLMLGEDYRGSMHVVPILLVGFLFLGLYYNVCMWYKITDLTHYGALISVAGVVITIALNVLLIPRFSVIGSAWAMLACYFCITVICWLLGRRYFPVPYDVPRILLLIVTPVAIYGISEWLRNALQLMPWQHIILNVIFFLAFTIIVYRSEREMIRTVIRRAV